MQSHSAQIKTEEFFNKVTVCLPGITLTCLRLRRHHQPARIACWATRLIFLFQPQPQAGHRLPSRRPCRVVYFRLFARNRLELHIR